MKLSDLQQKRQDATGYVQRRDEGDDHLRLPSAPLIWRAIRYATEVERKEVFSDIPGAKGLWTIRYSGKKPKKTDPLEDLRYFYINVDGVDEDEQPTNTWFELTPEDDDILEIHPDGDVYEITDPGGKFHV